MERICDLSQITLPGNLSQPILESRPSESPQGEKVTWLAVLPSAGLVTGLRVPAAIQAKALSTDGPL